MLLRNTKKEAPKRAGSPQTKKLFLLGSRLSGTNHLPWPRRFVDALKLSLSPSVLVDCGVAQNKALFENIATEKAIKGKLVRGNDISAESVQKMLLTEMWPAVRAWEDAQAAFDKDNKLPVCTLLLAIDCGNACKALTP